MPCPNANHSTICKFAEEDEDYYFVIDEIEALVEWALKSAGSVSISPKRPSNASSSFLDDRSNSEPGPSLDIQTHVGPNFAEDDQLTLFDDEIFYQDPPEVHRQARKGPFFLVPKKRNPQFVGQQDILRRLNHFSDPSNSMMRFALCGLGGVGKTQICLAHAHWHWLNYPEHSVFWIQASDTDQLRDSLGLIAAHCRISRLDDTTDIMLDRLRRWLSDESNGHWLMIIDSADNIQTFFDPSSDEQLGGLKSTNSIPSLGLSRYVPSCLHGKILITTNNKSTAGLLADRENVLEVHPMDKHNANTLLRKYLTEGDGTKTDIKNHHEPWRHEDLVTLAIQLDYLPLALVQAAAYISTNSLSVTGYLKLITNDQSVLPGVIETDFHALDESDDLSQAFMSTWRVAFYQIEQQSTLAVDLLSIMAFYEVEHIPKDLFLRSHNSPSQKCSRALDTLMAFSFITADVQNDTFSMHRLVQLAMRKRLSARNEEKKWANEALILISQNFPGGEYESWPMCATLIPHSLKVLRSELSDLTSARSFAILQSKISQYYLHRGLYLEANSWSRKALDNIILVPGVEQKEVFDIKSKRIIVLLKLDVHNEAEDLAKEVWMGRIFTLGAKHEDTLQILATLGWVYQEQGRYEDGEKALRKILKNLDRTLQADHIQILIAKQRLGSILRSLGRYKEAEEYQLATIQGYEKNLGPHHPDTLKAHWHLAQTYHAWGSYADAERIDMKTWSLQKRDDILGPNHPDTLKSLHGLANNFQAQFKFSAAEPYKREIYSKAKLLLNATHPYTLIAGSSLASCLVASNRYAHQPSPARLAEAEDLFRYTLTTREAKLRVDHPNTLVARTELVKVQRLRGQVPASELEVSERETLTKLKTVLGKNHQLTINSRDNLSRILWLQRSDSSKSKEALKEARHVFDFWKTRLGWWHEQTWLAAGLLVEMLPETDQETLDLRQKLQQWRRIRPTVDQE